MSFIFSLIDEFIEDLKIGKIHYVINRIRGLQEFYSNKLNPIHYEIPLFYKQKREEKNYLNNEKKFYYTMKFLNFNRILRRLYDRDIEQSIEMLREIQEEMNLNTKYVNMGSWQRYKEWKTSLKKGL